MAVLPYILSRSRRVTSVVQQMSIPSNTNKQKTPPICLQRVNLFGFWTNFAQVECNVLLRHCTWQMRTWSSIMLAVGWEGKPFASDSRLASQHMTICIRAKVAPVQLMNGGMTCSTSHMPGVSMQCLTI